MYDSKLFTMAYIYKISNSVNDKVYIGQTTYSLHDRFLDHKSRTGLGLVKSALYKAITKYGFDKFRIDSIVEGGFSKEELDALEIKYIKELGSLCPNGYNMLEGGRSPRIPEDIREKIRASTKGRVLCNPAKVSASVKKLWEDPEYRARQTKQRHEKRGSYRKGITRPNKRCKVNIKLLYSMKDEGKSVDFLANYFNVSTSTIWRRLYERF